METLEEQMIRKVYIAVAVHQPCRIITREGTNRDFKRRLPQNLFISSYLALLADFLDLSKNRYDP